MDFGIFLDFPIRRGGTHEEAFQETSELVDLAEETGLDTVWLGETHFSPERSVHSAQMVLASSIATRTKRLRVGSAVHVLPLIHPLRIAEEAATVDQISQGRFEFGVGRSGNIRAYDTMGIDYLESRERFQEALEIILQAWSGETFSYEGKFNHITNARLTPLPYQKPHPKVRIASTAEDSFSRVGRLGFPIFLSMRGMDVNELETSLKGYHQAWQEAGHPGESGDISVRFPMYLAPSDEEAVEEPKETIEAFFQRMRERYERGRFEEILGGSGDLVEARRARAARLAALTYEDILETKVIVGSPERVIDRLTQFKEMLGLTGFTAELNPGGLLPKEAVHRSLRLLTEEVMPAFK
jgi:alkanesulfonate monooxygenase SsuD/methylene tetrahydromethanopterin reductase-like flavin-dependent oxidoreductase (luciferase family)